MPITQTASGTEWRLQVTHPSELVEFVPGPDAGRVLSLRVSEESFAEVPEATPDRELSLSPFLANFPGLEELSLESHVFAKELAHPGVTRVELSGAIAATPLAMPAATHVVLSGGGDVHGVAAEFEQFSWLLEASGLPALTILDARGLDVELAKKPSFVTRWASAPVLKRLRMLGLPGEEIKLRELKQNLAAFEHLELLAISRLRSAADKNPIGGNVLFEDEFEDVSLGRLRETVEALPRLQGFKPSMKDPAFEEHVARIEASPIRFGEGPLTSTIAKFCTKGQWLRVRHLLALAKTKAPNRRAFMNVREAVEKHVDTYLEKAPDDAEARKLKVELAQQNAL